MSDCIFCKIANGDMKTDFIYEDDKVVAFRDINPRAPTHILIIPRQHIATLNDVEEQNIPLLGKITWIASKIAKDLQIANTGYRTVFNCNRGGGQEVYHLHCHLLGGRQMTWPPG